MWDGLSSEHKAIIKSAASAQNDETLSEFNARNGGALATLTGTHNVKLRKFSDEVMTSIGNASGEVLDAVAGSDVSSNSARTLSDGLDCRKPPSPRPGA